MTKIAKISSHLHIFKVFLYLILPATISQAYAVDWDKVNGKEITLMYPGQTSLQWLKSSSQHEGAAMVEKGKTCRMCHSDQEAEIGKNISSDKDLDAKSATAVPSFMPITVKTAHDGDSLFMQFQWLADAKQVFSISVMLDDGSVPQFKSAGCWLACHSDSKGMSQVSSQESSKYLLAARDKKDASVFTEYWQASIRQNATPQVVDGYVADKRHINKSTFVKADAKYQDGKWTVTFNRKLLTSMAYHKSFMSGKTVNFGIALHIGQYGGRYHLASFEHTLILDKGRADFVAAHHTTSAEKK